MTTFIAAALAAAAPGTQPEADAHAGHGSASHHPAGHEQHESGDQKGGCKMDCCKDKADTAKQKACAEHDEHADHQAKPKG